MHILFVHQNFPAQFGHVARYLVREYGYPCSFVTQRPPGVVEGVRVFSYKPVGGATKQNHYCTRTFENAVAHAHGVFEACKQHPDLKPDLVVGHSGFGSTLFLPELFACPIINYFEYYYRPHGSDLDFRKEFPPQPMDFLRSYCRNAMILLDLQNCAAGYCPTAWQRSLFPPEYAPKLDVIFDGVDTDTWHRQPVGSRSVGNHAIPPGTRVITYVSRGFESMRGFDVFMKVARRIYEQMPDVLFVVVGSDRVAYGGDLRYIPEKSYRAHVLKQDRYDLSKFLFTGHLPSRDLARLFSLSDLHIYLTVPFVLSWSLFDALACGCTVLASDTAPVRDLVTHEQTGLLADFHDVDGLADQALRVLRDPPAFRRLGEAGMALVEEKFTLQKCLPRMLELYQRVAPQCGLGSHSGAVRSEAWGDPRRG